MLFTTRPTPSTFFTTFSASDLSVGRTTCPSNITVSPSTLKARLSNTEIIGQQHQLVTHFADQVLAWFILLLSLRMRNDRYDAE
jgi:hypothetical protein